MSIADLLVPNNYSLYTKSLNTPDVTTPLLQIQGSTSGSVNISATATPNYGLVLPAAQGTSGQVLTNDGSGNLSWANQFATTVTANPADAHGVSPNTMTVSYRILDPKTVIVEWNGDSSTWSASGSGTVIYPVVATATLGSLLSTVTSQAVLVTINGTSSIGFVQFGVSAASPSNYSLTFSGVGATFSGVTNAINAGSLVILLA